MAYQNNYGGYSANGGGGGGGGGGYGSNNYTTTPYGAQGGADGGGFMGGSQGGSQGGGAGKGTYSKDTLRPLTILQILEASQPHPDADFKVDDVEITQVSLIGQVRNIAKQAVAWTYKLDDGTGTIEVKQWIDADNPPADEPVAGAKAAPQQGDWVKVYGKLKAFNNKRSVSAHVMRVLDDKNDINYHLLEATYVHLYFTRGPPESLNGAAQGQADGAANGGGGAGQNDGYGGKALPNLSMQARAVLKCLRETPQGNEGLHSQNIASVTRLQLADVMKGGDELIGFGLIFTTVDDNTWAVLED